jgi:hypothetical protein
LPGGNSTAKPSFFADQALRIIAVASDRAFDSGTTRSSLVTGAKTAPLSNEGTDTELDPDVANGLKIGETPDGYAYIRYPFDFIKITEATRFKIKGYDVPIIKETCGEGEIEIIIADFIAFAQSPNGDLVDVVGEKLIVFMGELGLYCCLNDGGGGYGYDFSSHKKLNADSIEKDLTPPIHRFYVNLDPLDVRAGYVLDNDTAAYETPTWFDVTASAFEYSNGSDLFDVLELQTLPQVSVNAQIVAIDEQTQSITVKPAEGFNLALVMYDEYVIFTDGERDITVADLKAGDKITAEYDRLYASYNPRCGRANKIIKNNS